MVGAMGGVGGLLWAGARAAAGIIVGAMLMAAIVHAAALRVPSTSRPQAIHPSRTLPVIVQLLKLAVVAVLLWIMVYILHVPGESLLIGLTAGVICALAVAYMYR